MSDIKREKFVRLAERTTEALNAIRKIGNLSNRRIYDYQDEDIKKICKALQDSISEVEGKFQSQPTNHRIFNCRGQNVFRTITFAIEYFDKQNYPAGTKKHSFS